MAVYPNEHPMNKTVAEMLCPGRPKTVLQCLKEFHAAMSVVPMPPGGYPAPKWFLDDNTPGNPSAALCRLLKDAMDEIEMHQRINGDLYRKLFPD